MSEHTPFLTVFPSCADLGAMAGGLENAHITEVQVNMAARSMTVSAYFASMPSPVEIGALTERLREDYALSEALLKPDYPQPKAAPAPSAGPGGKGDVLLGRQIRMNPVPMDTLTLDSGRVCVEGDVVAVSSRRIPKNGSAVLGFDITDYTNSVRVSRYIRAEAVIAAHMKKIFRIYDVSEQAIISITRNADISLSEEHYDEENPDFLNYMRTLLKKRDRLAPVRLELEGKAPRLAKRLCEFLKLDAERVYSCACPLKLDYIDQIEKAPGGLFNAPHTPVYPDYLIPDKPIWDQYVRQNLGLELTGKTQEEKLKNAIFLYGAIEKWYLDYLTTAEAQENLKAFDLLLPEYKWISDVKKIDCLLWSKR